MNNKNNVYPLKIEFQEYASQRIAEDKSESTMKSVFISGIVICIWCFAMCLLAKTTYLFLQEICMNSVQALSSNSK